MRFGWLVGQREFAGAELPQSDSEAGLDEDRSEESLGLGAQDMLKAVIAGDYVPFSLLWGLALERQLCGKHSVQHNS